MIARKFSQLGGLLLLGSTAFILISLFSFSPQDPTWNYYVSDIKHWHNWGGIWGASLVDWGLQLLGSALLLLIVMSLLGGWSLFSLRAGWALQIFWRGMLLLVAGSTLLALFFADDPLFRVIAFPGGFVGYYITDLLSPLALEGVYGITGGVIALALFVGLPYRRWGQQARQQLTTVRGTLHQRRQRLWPVRDMEESPTSPLHSRVWVRPQAAAEDTEYGEPGTEEDTLLEYLDTINADAKITQEEHPGQMLPQVSTPPAWETHLAVSVDMPKPEPASSAPDEPAVDSRSTGPQ